MLTGRRAVSGSGVICSLILTVTSPLLAQTADERRDFDRDDQHNQQQRDEWFYRQRAYPFTKIPKGARLNAWMQRRALEAIARGGARPEAAAALAPAWRFIGPEDNNFWGGNSSGRITALAVDPRSSQVVWAGAADGGVWKTTDGGAHWAPMTDGQPSLSTGALTLDPNHPDTIYIGTGEANQNSDSYGGAGILKSSDGGATWAVLGTQFSGTWIGAIAVSPANPQVVLVAGWGGIFRSANGGITWKSVLPGAMGSAVVFNPANPSTVWAGMGESFGDGTNGIYQSSNGGVTWTAVTGTVANPLPPASQIGRVAIALAPANPSIVYAGIGQVIGNSNPTNSAAGTGVYRSTDGGVNWTLQAQPGYEPNWYENTLAVSPADSSLLIGGGSQLYLSATGGTAWAAEPSYIHPDQHAVVFSADGSLVYTGNDGGVYSTADIANSAADWADLNSTLGVTQFYPGMSIDPSDLSVAIGGTQDNGTLIYRGSRIWKWMQCGDGGATAIDPVDPKNIYVACITGPAVAKSTDGGLTNQMMSKGFSATEGAPWPPYLAIDPSSPGNLYYTGNQHIYQSTNAAASWQAISPDITEGKGPPSVIVVAPSDSNTVYAGTQGGVLQVTRNALAGTGAAWADHTAGLPQRFITSIVVDPSNPALAYVALSGFGSGHVYVTSDAGATWQNISGNLPNAPVNDLALDPDADGTIYAGTDTGVFVSNNSGGIWTPLGNGLPNAVVTGVRFHRATRTLRVSTHGRGMWDLALRYAPPHRTGSSDSIRP
ncbi:MAG TPA: hypothetical protein VMB03_00515 [Bryobacteraceae bacterium]|nr:hypothetical protein [Bryobacteraceae bacterium]